MYLREPWNRKKEVIILKEVNNSSYPQKLLKLDDVLEVVPLSRPTIYRMIKQGDFPKLVKLWVYARVRGACPIFRVGLIPAPPDSY